MCSVAVVKVHSTSQHFIESLNSLLNTHAAEYAQVLRMLGQGRLEAQCMDGVKRLCHIRGKMRKKVWVNVGDIVLLGLREYQVLLPQ